MNKNNRAVFYYYRDAKTFIPLIVPIHANRAEVNKDIDGFWINVWWNNGEVAPLTVQEEAQALGER